MKYQQVSYGTQFVRIVIFLFNFCKFLIFFQTKPKEEGFPSKEEKTLGVSRKERLLGQGFGQMEWFITK
jgi:hypothetical protein